VRQSKERLHFANIQLTDRISTTHRSAHRPGAFHPEANEVLKCTKEGILDFVQRDQTEIKSLGRRATLTAKERASSSDIDDSPTGPHRSRLIRSIDEKNSRWMEIDALKLQLMRKEARNTQCSSRRH
jgi:hypothetical protein